MMFRAQPGVIWLDIVMAKYYRHSLRRHLIKLHPRNDQITIVRRAIRCHFCILTMTFTKKLTQEHVRRNSHELMQSVAGNGDWVIPAITNVTAALSVRLVLSSSHASSCIAAKPCSWLGSYDWEIRICCSDSPIVDTVLCLEACANATLLCA